VPENALRLAVPHGVVIIGDPGALPPASFEGHPVAVSDSVVAVATRHEVDGDVRLRLAAATTDESLPVRLFSGRLKLPGEKLT